MSAIRDLIKRAQGHRDPEALTDVFDIVEESHEQQERDRYLGIDVIQDNETGTVAFVEWGTPGRYIETDTMELFA